MTLFRGRVVPFLCALALPAFLALSVRAADNASPTPPAKPAPATITISTPMAAPDWATFERKFMDEMTANCLEFYHKYYDDQGNLQAVLRWGADDGPDDAFENFTGWPELHALGASDEILQTYLKGNDAMIVQYTNAKTTVAPVPRGGMFYKEFECQVDGMHLGEWSKLHNREGLSVPTDPKLIARARRYAGFYLGEDPEAQNYDPVHKIIRSVLNGSRGPMLRKATPVDWVGDPVDISKFPAVHGEANYQDMLNHYNEYGDVAGDSFLNVGVTNLVTTAYMLTHDAKYKQWVLDYMDAWVARMKQNHWIIPSYVALDGTIGGSEGKWWGNAYGWGFSPLSTAQGPGYGRPNDRNRIQRALCGFGNALWLTGDQKYVDAWRNMLNSVNSNATTVNGRTMYPTMYGANGWYSFRAQPWSVGAVQIWYWSMKPEDLALVAQNPWVKYVLGQNPDYPMQGLQRDYALMQRHVAAFRADTTTPETRLADNELDNDPASSLDSLMELMMGCPPPLDAGRDGGLIHARLRYFDPVKKRAGLPPDVGALVSLLTDTSTTVTFVNLSPTEPRTFVVQGGAYAEHRIESATLDGKNIPVNSTNFTLTLAPGAGGTLTLAMKRFATDPTELFPWEQ